jgi:hypothetical protein
MQFDHFQQKHEDKCYEFNLAAMTEEVKEFHKASSHHED